MELNVPCAYLPESNKKVCLRAQKLIFVNSIILSLFERPRWDSASKTEPSHAITGLELEAGRQLPCSLHDLSISVHHKCVEEKRKKELHLS